MILSHLKANSYKLQTNKGFTLVELAIYMGLLTILVLIFTEIFISVTDNQLSSRNTSNVADDGRYIYSRIMYDVSRADAITLPVSYGDTNQSLELSIDGGTYTYSLSDGKVVLTTPEGSFDLNGYGTDVASLSFTKIGSAESYDTVQINYVINGTIDSRGISDTQTYQTTIGLR